MASTRDRDLSIAAKVGLNAEELNKPCDDRLFPLLANFVHPWRLVFSSLLSEVDLDDIDQEKQSRSEQEKRVAALRKWKARKGHDATYGALLGAILDSGKVDQAELLCEQVALQSDSQQADQNDAARKTSTKSAVHRLSPLPAISHAPLVAVEQFSPGSLEEEIERLDEEYTEIESLVLEMIKENHIPHKTMLKWIQVLPMTLKSQFSELLQRNAKALSNASNVDELFFIVSPYWNSLHPTLLVHLVKKLANEKLKGRMKKYTDDLYKFRARTQLGDFIERWAGGIPPGFDEFVLELGEQWRERTVEDLEQFRIRLSRQQCAGGHMTYIKKVMPGSILTTLVLPQCCFPLSFDEDTKIFLREEHVLGVYIDGLCILDLQEKQNMSDDEGWELEIEDDAVAVKTTSWSDSESENMYSYSNDVDAEYNEQIQPSSSDEEAKEDNIKGRAYESGHTFPSSSSVNVRFLYGSLDGFSAISPETLGRCPRFRMTPLKRTGEVELQIDMMPGICLQDIDIGLERCIEYDLQGEASFVYSDPDISIAEFNSLKRSASLNIGYPRDNLSLTHNMNRIGLKITRDGTLKFFVNGQSLGIAAERAYKLGGNFGKKQAAYYPLLWLPAGANKATLIAGAAQTEVLSLQQICIDCVAESLECPEHALYLPLPLNLKGKIAEDVFGPRWVPKLVSISGKLDLSILQLLPTRKKMNISAY